MGSEGSKLVRQQNNDASVTQSFSNRFADADRAITARPASMARQDVGTQTSDSDAEHAGMCTLYQNGKKYHIVPFNESYNPQFPKTKYLPNQTGSKVYVHCTVPELLRKEGFPVPPGKKMPRLKKKEQKS